MALLNDTYVWTTACPYDHLIRGRGVDVLLDAATQAALFRLDDGSVHTVGKVDPFSGAAVTSRGIVGDRGGRTTVQSPIFKQAFALDDCCCLDDPRVSVPVHRARVTRRPGPGRTSLIYITDQCQDKTLASGAGGTAPRKRCTISRATPT